MGDSKMGLQARLMSQALRKLTSEAVECVFRVDERRYAARLLRFGNRMNRQRRLARRFGTEGRIEKIFDKVNTKNHYEQILEWHLQQDKK